MSFILEALRKSEAERRRGQTPDLLSDAMPVAPAARASSGNRGRNIAIVAAALIALLLVVWALRSPAPAGSAAVSTAAPSTTPSIAATTIPALPTPASLSPPPARVTATPTAQTPTSAPAVVIPPATAGTTTAPTAPQTHEPQSRAAESELSAPASSTQVAKTEPANTAIFASPDAPLKLADLPTDERQQLPALKVSMHMWAPDVANRFAIIDGARVNEGDRVGDATVEAIQSDGVMLSWRGRRIRLPIR